MSKIIILGNGQIAELMFFYLLTDTDHTVAAFTVNKAYKKSNIFMSLPVVDFENLEKLYPPSEYKICIAMGYDSLNRTRTQKFLEVKNRGYSVISYIHSTSRYWNDNSPYAPKIGEGCLVFENATIQPFSEIEDNCIVWSGTHISHHTLIKAHCFIAPRAALAGNVIVEQYCFIGTNATIRNGVTIGAKSIIGAGAVIKHNIPLESVYSATATSKHAVKSSQINL